MNRSELELEKKTINLRRGDWLYLTHYLKPKGIQPSTYIRSLLSARVDAAKAQTVDLDTLLEELE